MVWSLFLVCSKSVRAIIFFLFNFKILVLSFVCEKEAIKHAVHKLVVLLDDQARQAFIQYFRILSTIFE